MHPFEKAGLGQAPYSYLGFEKKMHKTPGGTMQPGSTCDYCSTAIGFEYWFQGKDGKRFKVGSDCMLKADKMDHELVYSNEPGYAGYASMKDIVKREQSKQDKAKSREKFQAQQQARTNARDQAYVDLERAKDKLQAKPHPKIPGKTLYDYIKFMLDNRYEGKVLPMIQQALTEHIVKVGSKYRLLSKKGKNLGTFDSHAAAAKHEGEVEYFKAHESHVKSFGDYLVENDEALYYHGTSDAVQDAIDDNGLVHHASDQTTPDEDTSGDRANSVYLTKEYDHAMGYALRAAKKLGGAPLVQTVRIPYEFQQTLVADEADPKGVRFRGTIPTEWVS